MTERKKAAILTEFLRYIIAEKYGIEVPQGSIVVEPKDKEGP